MEKLKLNKKGINIGGTLDLLYVLVIILLLITVVSKISATSVNEVLTQQRGVAYAIDSIIGFNGSARVEYNPILPVTIKDNAVNIQEEDTPSLKAQKFHVPIFFESEIEGIYDSRFIMEKKNSVLKVYEEQQPCNDVTYEILTPKYASLQKPGEFTLRVEELTKDTQHAGVIIYYKENAQTGICKIEHLFENTILPRSSLDPNDNYAPSRVFVQTIQNNDIESDIELLIFTPINAIMGDKIQRLII